MKRIPKHAPRKVDSTADLKRLQTLMSAALMRPLTEDDNLQPTWTDGRSMAKVAEEFIKPNDRLTSFDRLELYSQLYWYRVTEALRVDFPGLLAVIGERKFRRLTRAYLSENPSRSFTLRNLGSRLVDFIRANPGLASPRLALALEVARFEWAQTVAFDGPALPVISPHAVAATPPSKLKLGVQPYMTLLDLRHPVDAFMISVKRRDTMRSDASNTVTGAAPARVRRPSALPKRKRTCVVVHRYQNRLFYKRLSPPAFRILEALASGKTVARAVETGGPGVRPSQVRAWFAAWMALGWFCERAAPSA